VNVIEWGNGIYGVNAASQHYFGHDASSLTKREAALLAAAFQIPGVGMPKSYELHQRRANWVMGRMNSVAIPKE